jgi:hypothetical protein
MQPSRADLLKKFRDVALPKPNNAFKQFETIGTAPLAATDSADTFMLLTHGKARRIQIFFGKALCGTRSRVILEALFAVDFACGGAYPVGCWGVVQSVGHLTVNEDGGGSNPPAPANFSQSW